jgi:pimeloyl-ACP methyl ester carboxylesterase
MGGGVAMQMALDASERLASLTLVSPLSPYGFGGTVDTQGTPLSPDFAGSGGGTVNPIFVQRIKEGDRGSEDANSPRNVLRAFYVHPGFRPAPELEDEWVTSMLSTKTGEDYYPGDFTPSSDWPGVAPGSRGVANAMSPEYVDLSALSQIEPQPPILWIRGARDLIVSDRSMFDLAVLGEMGLVPDWPGPRVAPPQPMLAQTRVVLDAYAAAGGSYQETVYENSAHSPHLEEPDRFRADFVDVVSGEE